MKSIRAKLIVSILAITLLPVLPLYFLVDSLVRETLQVGLNARVETALEQATTLSRLLYGRYKQETRSTARRLAESDLVRNLIMTQAATNGVEQLMALPERSRILLYTKTADRVFAFSDSLQLDTVSLTSTIPQLLARADTAEFLVDASGPQIISVFAPVFGNGRLIGGLIYSQKVEAEFAAGSANIVEVNQMFKTLGVYEEVLRAAFIKAFFLIYVPIAGLSLLAGFYFSRRITSPLVELAEGTTRVAAGDWDYRIAGTRTDELGRLIGAFNTMVRNLKRQQDQVVALEKMAVWREMARVLAHEIKNPLTPIQLTVQQIRDAYAGDDDRYKKLLMECTGIITEEINRLEQLVREFSEYARTPEMRFARGDLNSVVEATAKLYQQQKTVLDLEEALPEFSFDSEQIRRVLINFFENSTRSLNGAADAEIHIRTRAESDGMTLSFSDNGPGIAPEIAGKIFEPYFSTRKNGMGLGLAIVRKIIEEHGGTIALDSHPGKGATFMIRLRYHESDRETSSPNPLPKPEE